jgi:hypothetical protein
MQWSSVKWSRLIKLMLLGAIGFWLPDTFLHGLRGYNFDGRDVRIVTIVSPLTLLITFLLVRWANKTAPRLQIIPSLIAGVWIFGGLFMTIGATFAGGGFKTPAGGALIAILLSLLPIYTFIMATYDGALAALLLVTAVALFVWIVQRSGVLLRFSHK